MNRANQLPINNRLRFNIWVIKFDYQPSEMKLNLHIDRSEFNNNTKINIGQTLIASNFFELEQVFTSIKFG